MYRDETEVGFRTPTPTDWCEKAYNRKIRTKDDIEYNIHKTEHQIHNVTNKLAALKNTKDNKKTIRTLNRLLDRLNIKLNNLRTELDAKNNGFAPSQKRIKHHGKKWNLTKLEKAVMNIIHDAKANNCDALTKEDTAKHLNARASQVEQVFMTLNRKGILSQAEHRAPHDSSRDPWGFPNSSQWCSDLYYIL